MDLTSLLVFLGFGIPALFLLLLTALFARTERAIVASGLIAAFLMAFQCLALFALIGWGEAWSGDSGSDSLVGWLAVGFGFTVIIYFRVATLLASKRRERTNRTQNSEDPKKD